MAPAAPRRQRGTVSRWEDGRGFGFVTSEGGGAPVFLHIRALPSNDRRPTVGDRLEFLSLDGAQGPFAKQARFLDEVAAPNRVSVAATAAATAGREARAPAGAQRPRRGADMPVRHPMRRRPERSGPSVPAGLVIGLAVLGYAAATWFWRVPPWVGMVYLGMSLVALLVYADDKDAARTRRWRASENKLLTIGLLGGWPGALIAQRLLRHKTRKAAFQWPFWLSVAVNVAAFVIAFSPAGWLAKAIAP